jgi:hypothetical protein
LGIKFVGQQDKDELNNQQLPLQGAGASKLAAGLSVCCNAKTAEVLAAERGSNSATYECTVRGVAVGNDRKDLFVLEYRPQVS